MLLLHDCCCGDAVTGTEITSMSLLMYNGFRVMHILTHKCYQAAHIQFDIAEQQFLVVEPVRAPWPGEPIRFAGFALHRICRLLLWFSMLLLLSAFV